MEFIDLKAQYARIKKNIDNRISTVLSHGKHIMGPEVFEFEEKLADYVGVKHAISCANGTDALQLSLMALNIGKGDAVFCPTFTFFATAEVIALAGATPVFIDSEPETFNICPNDLILKIKQVKDKGELTPKAIIPVDLFGLPANFQKIIPIASEHNLQVIEDAAQGLGGEINGKKAGSFGDIATTSFFPAKPLGCFGDGGMVFTNNDNYAEIIKSLRIHGKGQHKYDNVRIGLNSRLDTIQAAILLEKLAIFPEEIELRQQVASDYHNIFKDKLITPIPPEGYKSAWAQYTLKCDNRQDWISKFNNVKVPTAVYYEKCMHQQSVFQHLKVNDNQLPVATNLAKSVFSVPMHPYVDTQYIQKIINP